MGKTKTTKKPGSATIIRNKKATHDYLIEDRFEAGIVLEGWEVKALRSGKAQLVDSYVILQNGEAYLVGCHINPLATASTHVKPAPQRSRKLLLNKKELSRLIGATEQKGYTIVALSLYWKHGLVKVEIALGKGKKLHDKRAAEKDKDWNREKERLFKQDH